MGVTHAKLTAWIEGRRYDNRCSPPCGCCTVPYPYTDQDAVNSRIASLPNIVLEVTAVNCTSCQLFSPRRLCVCKGTGKAGESPTHPMLRLAMAAGRAMILALDGCGCPGPDMLPTCPVIALDNCTAFIEGGPIPELPARNWRVPLVMACRTDDTDLRHERLKRFLKRAHAVLGERLWVVLSEEVATWA